MVLPDTLDKPGTSSQQCSTWKMSSNYIKNPCIFCYTYLIFGDSTLNNAYYSYTQQTLGKNIDDLWIIHVHAAYTTWKSKYNDILPMIVFLLLCRFCVIISCVPLLQDMLQVSAFYVFTNCGTELVFERFIVHCCNLMNSIVKCESYNPPKEITG